MGCNGGLPFFADTLLRPWLGVLSRSAKESTLAQSAPPQTLSDVWRLNDGKQ
jgi:hypothetical protein